MNDAVYGVIVGSVVGYFIGVLMVLWIYRRGLDQLRGHIKMRDQMIDTRNAEIVSLKIQLELRAIHTAAAKNILAEYI